MYQRKWENETCDRPLGPESASNSAAFQDGDQHIYQGTTSLDLTEAYFHIPISPKFRKFLRFVWEDRVYAFKTTPFGLSTAPLVFTRIFQAVVAHLHSQSIFIHSYLDNSLLENMSPFLLRNHTHFVIGLLLKLGFLISWKKSELVPSQDFIFLGEHYRTDLGLVFPTEEKILTTISGEQSFSDIVNTSSSIFTADRFSDFSDGCYSSGPSTYTTNAVVPEGVLASSYSNVGGLYSCSSQTTASSVVVVTEVQPFDRCTSGPPRFHIDSLHRRLSNRMGCLPRRENSVRGVGRLSFRRTHKSSGNEGSSIVIETLPRGDSKTVSVDSH